jgi:hypothetical protein
MSSIGDVGDALWVSYAQAEESVASARKADSVAAEAQAKLSNALEGSSSTEAHEAQLLLRQAREVMDEAVRLLIGGQETLAQYIRSITVRGPGSTRLHPDGSYRAPDGKYAGVHNMSRSGADAEAEAHRRFKRRGLEVDERQQHCVTTEEIHGVIRSGPRKGVMTLPAGTVRKYDGAVKIRGKWYGIETKGGTASKTPEQRAVDDWLKRPGNTLTSSDGRILEGVQEVRIKYS